MTIEQAIKFEFSYWKEVYNSHMETSSKPADPKHISYTQLLTLGKEHPEIIIPLIYDDLFIQAAFDPYRPRMNPTVMSCVYWFPILHKITGTNPVPENHAGYTKQVNLDWIKWIEDNYDVY